MVHFCFKKARVSKFRPKEILFLLGFRKKNPSKTEKCLFASFLFHVGVYYSQNQIHGTSLWTFSCTIFFIHHEFQILKKTFNRNWSKFRHHSTIFDLKIWFRLHWKFNPSKVLTLITQRVGKIRPANSPTDKATNCELALCSISWIIEPVVFLYLTGHSLIAGCCTARHYTTTAIVQRQFNLYYINSHG